MIHLLSDVQSEKIGENTTIWQFSIILKGAEIGKNCNINCHTFIENDVIIGDNVTVKSGVFIWDGITIGNNVFLGPNVTFTNDSLPRSKQYPSKFQRVVVNDYASIGANSTVMGGVSIGKFALIGAGTLVTKDIPERALVIGSPARIIGWVNDDGTKMQELDGHFIDSNNLTWVVENNKLERK